MPTQTDISTQELNECLYDILMGAIEPDLTLDMLPILDELYLNESEDEHAERMQRYAEAIQLFKDRSKKFTNDCKAEMLKMKTYAVALAKNANAAQDKSDLGDIEQSITQS